ncbi:MAG: signal peptidase II [Rhizobiales bacterium]|nr:signal peptidase II [Hyphomicrobiales bacterium]
MADQPEAFDEGPKWPLWSARSSRVLAIALVTLVLDQLSKLWVLFSLNLIEGDKLTIAPFVDILLVWNRGISYGLFQQHSDWGRWLLVAFGLIACIVVWIWVNRAGSLWFLWGAALIIGGGLGNSIDRIAYGAVVDFVSLHAYGFYWYVFNIADIAIVAGFLLLLYDMFISGKEKPS